MSMIFGIDAEQLQYWLGMGHVAASGITDPTYDRWTEAMRQYSTPAGSVATPQVTFWMVVSLPKEGFSENVEAHPELPLIVPASGLGTLVGIATSKSALDEMTIPRGPGPNQGDEWKKDERRNKIFIAYKVKLSGTQDWRDLLEFCGEHNMLADAN